MRKIHALSSFAQRFIILLTISIGITGILQVNFANAALTPDCTGGGALPSGCPGSKTLNQQFRDDAKTQIDDVLNTLKPDNAPDFLPGSFKTQIQNDKETGGIPLLLSYVSGIIASLAGLVAMINIIYNSYLYMTSHGDTGKTGKAQKAIVWSLIGLVGIIFSYNIVYSVIKLVWQQVANGLV